MTQSAWPWRDCEWKESSACMVRSCAKQQGRRGMRSSGAGSGLQRAAPRQQPAAPQRRRGAGFGPAFQAGAVNPVVLGPPATAPWRPVRRSTGPSVSRPGFAVCAGGTRFAPKSSRAPTCKCQFPHRDAKSHVSAESGPVVNQSIDEAAGHAARPDRTTHRCTETPVNEPQQEAARVKEKGGLQEHVSAFVVVLEIQ